MGNTSFIGLIYYISLIAGGLLAVSGYLIENNPKAKEIIDKLGPVQGIIGIGIIVLGVWNLIVSFANIKAFVFWLMGLYIILLSLCLGILLGFGLVIKLLGSNEEAKKKAGEIVSKIERWRTPIGWINVANGILILWFGLAIRSMFP